MSIGTNCRIVLVVAHPRTGSSLAMQTMHHLGLSVWGPRVRPDLPLDANPKGYFEDRELVFGGLTKSVVAQMQRQQGNAAAAKLSLVQLVGAGGDHFKWVLSVASAVIIPIRDPIESALSRRVFDEARPETVRAGHRAAAFMTVASSLCQYVQDYRKLGELLATCSKKHRQKITFLEYRLAHQQPHRYVLEVCSRLGLQLAVDSEEVSSAVRNIDPNLYRYRVHELDQKFRDWDVKIGARALFNRLEAQGVHALAR